METFRDAQDVYNCIGKIFEEGIADPEIGPKTKESGLTILFTFTNPDSVIYVDFAKGEVFYGDGVPETDPAIKLGMTADDANKVWLGMLNMAMAKDRPRPKGSLPEMLKMLPPAKASRWRRSVRRSVVRARPRRAGHRARRCGRRAWSAQPAAWMRSVRPVSRRIPGSEPGMVCGHEFTGEVVEVGTGVLDVAAGERCVASMTLAAIPNGLSDPDLLLSTDTLPTAYSALARGGASDRKELES